MNLFNKTVVASAIVSSFGASAEAIVASSPLVLSAEGVAAGNVAAPQLLSLDIVVGTDHPSASTITLTFDDKVDLANGSTSFAGLADGVTNAVTNDPALGLGTAGNLQFSYGTGSFTFDNVTFTNGDQTMGESDTISFVVNLGNPLTANSAFRIESVTTAEVLYSGIASVDYSAVTAGGDAIETGTSALTTTASQFSFTSGLDFDAIINRDNTAEFTVGSGSTTQDVVDFTYINNKDLLGAIDIGTYKLVLNGNFSDRSDPEFQFELNGNSLPGGSSSSFVDVTDDGVTLDNLRIFPFAAPNILTATFTGNGTGIEATGDITADFLIITATGVTTPGFLPYTIETGVDAGEWVVDATVLNVPYFPVGYTGTESTVQFANESVNSADVIVSAIDDDGVEYGPLDLGFDLAGDTVTTLSESALISLFGLTDATKLSVTFNIDAEDGDVNAYAFSVNEGKRAQLMTSQQNTLND
jgi:hypothetical protein